MIRVRIENRSRSNQQRLSPLRKVWNISRETHDTFLEPWNCKQPHRIVHRCIFQLPACSYSVFQNSFDVLRIETELNLQFRARMSRNHVRSGAAAENSDVARRRTKETVFGPMTIAIIMQNVQQFFDRRLARFGIRRMCSASFSGDDYAYRTLRADRQTAIGRLPINQELTITRERVFVCRLGAETAELFVNSKEQSNIIHTITSQVFRGKDLRRDDPFRIT